MKIRITVFAICLTIIGIGIANLVPVLADTTVEITQNAPAVTEPTPAQNSNQTAEPSFVEISTPKGTTLNANPPAQNNPTPTQAQVTHTPQNNQPNNVINPCQQ